MIMIFCLFTYFTEQMWSGVEMRAGIIGTKDKGIQVVGRQEGRVANSRWGRRLGKVGGDGERAGLDRS